jgi:hypothetical protein
MTSEKIKEVFDKHYNIEHLLGAKESLACFTVENFLSGKDKPLYLCSDRTRNKFYFLDKDNKRIDDSNAQILINLIIKYGIDSIEKTYKKYSKNTKKIFNIDSAFQNITTLAIDGKEYINKLSDCLPTSVEERRIRDDIGNEEIVFEIESEDEDENPVTISGFSLTQLNKYKVHYKKTGQILIPSIFEKNKENLLSYRQFLKS